MGNREKTPDLRTGAAHSFGAAATGVQQADLDAERALARGRQWLLSHGGTSVPWSAPAESGAETGDGIDAILQQHGTDLAARLTALLVCSDPLPTPAELNAMLGDPLALEVGELLTDCARLMALSSLGGGNAVDAASNPAELLRRMTLAMAGDIRVIIVRLAAGLHGLRQAVRLEGSAGGRSDSADNDLVGAALAREALSLLSPLANRLGLFSLKWEIEDLAFRLSDPSTYRDLARRMDAKRAEREATIASARALLSSRLSAAGLAATVSGRPKHLFSIHQKMRQKGLPLEGLHDLRALRVLVETVGDCYAALDVVHACWSQLPAEFDDYISRPKPNGYQSLHTVVVAPDGRTLEVQIRTLRMHELAEYGVAAHWRYKEGAGKLGAADGGQGDRLVWLRQLLAWQQDLGIALGQEGASTRDDARIFALTPQGRVIELPAGATPVDFAYRLHTTLGHRCRGAKVDGRLVPLSTPLVNGQVVEIVPARRGAPSGPSRDWLNPVTGFVKSTRARAKVRQWFNALEREGALAEGRERVEKLLAREGQTALSFAELASRLGEPDAEALFVAVAQERIGPRALEDASRLGSAPPPAQPPSAVQLRAPAVSSAGGEHGVLVVGVDFLLTQLARCCHPLPPDPIRGFVTRGKGVSIHRSGCDAILRLARDAPDRVLTADWGDWRSPPRARDGKPRERRYPAAVQLDARDRPGLLHDISEIFVRERMNVLSVRSHTRHDAARVAMVVEAPDSLSLARVLAQVARVAGVSACRRI